MNTLECAHCGDDVPLPAAVADGDEIACDNCDGVNVLSCDAETAPYFRSCEAMPCAACEVA